MGGCFSLKFPLGPLTFWWSVNSAQRSRNSQCSPKNMNEKFSVFFRRRECCEGGSACGLGLKWVRDLVWLILRQKHPSVKIVCERIEKSKNQKHRSVKDRLWKNWKSLTWHYWHHSALTGVSDIPDKVSVSFMSWGGPLQCPGAIDTCDIWPCAAEGHFWSH